MTGKTKGTAFFNRWALSRLALSGWCWLWLMVVLSFSRLLYFFWNYDLLAAQSGHARAFWVGWQMDASVSAAVALTALILAFSLPWQRSWARWVLGGYMLLPLPFLALGIVDVELSRFLMRRSSMETIFLLGEDWALKDVVRDYAWLFVIGGGGLFLLYWFLFRSLSWFQGRIRAVNEYLGGYGHFLAGVALTALAYFWFLLFLFRREVVSAGTLPDYVWLLLAVMAAFLLFCGWRFHRRYQTAVAPAGAGLQRGYFIMGTALLVIAALWVLIVAIRGGVVRSRPLALTDAPTGHLSLLATNTPFVFFNTLGSSVPPRLSYLESDAEVVQALTPEPLAFAALPNPPKNVVVLVMESLSQSYLGRVNGVAGYMPFVDQLGAEGLFFDNAFCNTMTSIMGVPTVLANTPSFYQGAYLESPYVDIPVYGLGQLLQDAGAVDTWFFSGAHTTSLRLDRMSENAGFTSQFGIEQYPGDKSVITSWGVHDRPYFRYMAQTLKDKVRPPFAAAVFSLSAHHPFRFPEEEQFSGDAPLRFRSQSYADAAIRDLVDGLRTAPWFKDTLFVITADHGSEVALPQYQTHLGGFRVPIIFWQEGRDWSALKAALNVHQPASQLDILPTIADLMGIKPRQKNWLGRSLVSSKPHPIFIRNWPDAFVVDEGAFLHYQPDSDAATLITVADGKASTDEAHRARLKRHAQAVLQYYYNGVIGKKLFLPNDTKP